MVLTQSTTLTADHAGNIRIVADGVTLDCAGHTVHGPGVVAPGADGFSGGIDFASLKDITIRNCLVTRFQYNGVYGYGSDNVRIEDNRFVANGNHGIHLEAVANSVIVGNLAQGNGAINPALGIVLTESTHVTIEANAASGNRWGGIALLNGTTESGVVGNVANRNGGGFIAQGGASNNTFTGNAANGNSDGFIVVDGANGNTFTNNTADGNEYIGFQIATDWNTFTGNIANGNNDGFNLYGADGNVLTGNLANGNHNYGFVVFGGSSDNSLTNDTGLGNGYVDAWDVGTGNLWSGNKFRTTFGI
jgi:parallel beta-helix repeat protein